MLPAVTITIAVTVTVRDLRGLAAALVLQDPEVVPVRLVLWDLRVNPDFRVIRVLLGLPGLLDSPDLLGLLDPPDLLELLAPLDPLELPDPLELMALQDLPELPGPPDLPAL